eukprot:7379107-Pyramimonas_sp.AAC.1
MAQGLSASALLKRRSPVACPAGYKRPGGCPTACIRLGFGGKDDPMVQGRMQVFTSWLEKVAHMPERMGAIEIVWSRAVTHLQADARHWGRVKGLIGPVVACLMDLHWDPIGPASWGTPRGEVLHVLELDREHLLNFEIKQAL